MIVLDASAIVDVVADQPCKADVLTHLGEELVAPAHQPAEVLSALARLVRGGVLSAEAARDAVSEANDLRQDHVLPTERHIRRALELQNNVRVLDGLYVALAEEWECPLLTTDGRLARTAQCQTIVPGA